MAAISFAMFGLLVMLFYVLFALRRQWVPQALKKRWASHIFIGNIYPMPVIWYFLIWKDRSLDKRPTLDQFTSGAA